MAPLKPVPDLFSEAKGKKSVRSYWLTELGIAEQLGCHAPLLVPVTCSPNPLLLQSLRGARTRGSWGHGCVGVLCSWCSCHPWDTPQSGPRTLQHPPGPHRGEEWAPRSGTFRIRVGLLQDREALGSPHSWGRTTAVSGANVCTMRWMICLLAFVVISARGIISVCIKKIAKKGMSRLFWTQGQPSVLWTSSLFGIKVRKSTVKSCSSSALNSEICAKWFILYNGNAEECCIALIQSCC